MELTDNEKRWLRGKELAPRAYCVWCYKFDVCSQTCKQGWCPTDYTPVDDFEARVAAKLAAVFRDITHVFGGDNPPLPCKYCPANACCKLSNGCDEGILKWARIAVEEEMSNEAD